MKNRFYEMSNSDQKAFQIKLGALCLLVILFGGLIFLLIDIRLLPVLVFIIAIIISVVAPFLDVPALIKTGRLKYFSLFLLAEKENQGVVKIHGGTLFDYYFVLDKNWSGQERMKCIMSEYLKGLLNLTTHYNPDIIIRGTSYIINERTARKVGMKKIKTDGFQKIILLFNVFNLMVSIYLSKNKIEFPNLSQINTYQCKIEDILKNKDFIHELISKIGQHTTGKS